jgi:lipoprotein-releasing system permease protein
MALPARKPTNSLSPGWIAYVAGRYFNSRRSDGSGTSSTLSVLGIAIGVTTLITVLGVMNGFQMGFIDSILEISSYHVRVESGPARQLSDEASLYPVLRAVRSQRGVEAAVPFIEIQSIARGLGSGMQGCAIRALPPDVAKLDSGFASSITMTRGNFDLAKPLSIAVGSELARSLGVDLGDRVSIVSVPTTGSGGLSPIARAFTVTGVFKSGYYEYDSGLAFVSLADGAALSGISPRYQIGVKLFDRYADADAAFRLASLPETVGCRVESWRDFNRAFFGALRMEKTMMMLIIGLIFIVVGVNIYHSLRRSIYERRDEIGLLRAVGASPRAVRSVFVCTGALIGGVGAVVGLLLGLYLSANINGVFALAEGLVNGALALAGAIVRLFGISASTFSGGFSIFSPTYFYLTEVPSRVLFPEALLIFMFGLLSAAGAAFFASAQVAGVKPAEALRYE